MTTLAMPDLLGRNDFVNGQWEVAETPMAPGQSWTILNERKMQVPEGDTELERVVRAHEMMHAKVSPEASMEMWIKRDRATLTALKAAEEIRVNELCKRTGFDMKKVFDGTEKVGGEFAAKNDRWEQAVYDAAAFAGTGRLTEYLKGVRKHNPEWAKTLKAFADRLSKIVSRIPTSDLASTNIHPQSGLAPFGFSYTESLAVLIDGVANPPKPPEEDPHEEQEAQEADPQPDAGDAEAKGEEKPKPLVTPEEAKKMDMPDAGSYWHDLIVERLPMPRNAPGGIGKKRKASAMGRTPRRIGRMLTDPDKKVFDVVRRGKGGVVLIDGSASMQFTEEDIKKITEAAPGALVALYCADRGDANKPNLYIIADKGRMVSDLPHRANGNGVDAPAARWAIAQKQTATSPVVWITDGLVHGPNQRYTDSQGIECAQIAYTNGVIVRPNVESAISMLQELQKGRKPKRWFPNCWQRSWRTSYGKALPSVRI